MQTEIESTNIGAASSNDAELGPRTWIETNRGFPEDGYGARPELRPDPAEILASANSSSGGTHIFTSGQGADIIAFTEFLAGTALDDGERSWLIDAMAREFLADPDPAAQQLVSISNAVLAIPELTPAERANNRHKALTAMYRAEQVRERNGRAETPTMAVIRAHNPPLFIDGSGLVIVADAHRARTVLNDLVLTLGRHSRAAQPNLRTALADGYRDLPAMMQVELAGSQIRLVVLRAWLEQLPQSEMDQLRDRLSEAIATATDLDLVTLQLSFRSMIEAFDAAE